MLYFAALVVAWCMGGRGAPPPNAIQAPDAVPETKPGAKELSGRAGDVTSFA